MWLLSVKRKISKAKQYYFTLVFSLAVTLSMLFASFSLLDAVLIKGLPYKSTQDLYWIEGTIEFQGNVIGQTNSQALLNIKQKSKLFSDVSIYFPWTEYKLAELPARPDVPVYMVSDNFFKTLGVAPEYGRFFNEQEALGNFTPSVVLSKGAWQQYFGSQQNIVGRQVRLNNRSFTVVGITSESLPLPQRSDHEVAIYIPLDMDEVMNPVTFDGFGGDIKAIARSNSQPLQLKQEVIKYYQESAKLNLPEFLLNYHPSARLSQLSDAVIGDSRSTIMLTLVGALLLMAITLINLGNLQMAKAIGQLQKISISYAFGATRKQIFKELAGHNLAIVGIAVILALIITWFSLDLIKDLGTGVIPRVDQIGISINMCVIALIVLLAIAGLFSWLELSTVNESDLRTYLQSSGKGTGKQIKESTNHWLVALQVCFSVIVLIATSQVLVLTASEAFRDKGITTDNLAELVINFSAIEDRQDRKNLLIEIRRVLESHPEIRSTSYSSEKRLPESLSYNHIYNEKKEKVASSRRTYIEADYLNKFAISVNGSEFTMNDGELENPPVIINKRLARLFTGNPIGQSIYIGNDGPYRINGIASNTDFPGDKRLEISQLYFPATYFGGRSATLVMDLAGPTESLSKETLIAQLSTIDARLDLKSFSWVTDDFDRASRTLRMTAYLSGVISAISLIMVIAGIFGVVSYMINLRKYDLGVKLAMGATNRLIIKSQLLKLAAPILAAMLFAFSAAYLFLGYSRTVPDWVFEVDWGAIGLVLISLSVILIFASSLPILKILSIDPIKALRNE